MASGGEQQNEKPQQSGVQSEHRLKIFKTALTTQPSQSSSQLKSSLLEKKLEEENLSRQSRYEQVREKTNSKSRQQAPEEFKEYPEQANVRGESPLQRLRRNRDLANEEKMSQIRKQISTTLIKKYVGRRRTDSANSYTPEEQGDNEQGQSMPQKKHNFTSNFTKPRDSLPIDPYQLS